MLVYWICVWWKKRQLGECWQHVFSMWRYWVQYTETGWQTWPPWLLHVVITERWQRGSLVPSCWLWFQADCRCFMVIIRWACNCRLCVFLSDKECVVAQMEALFCNLAPLTISAYRLPDICGEWYSSNYSLYQQLMKQMVAVLAASLFAFLF